MTGGRTGGVIAITMIPTHDQEGIEKIKKENVNLKRRLIIGAHEERERG